MAVKEGMELVHWMGDDGTSSGWQPTGMRESDLRVETADFFQRKDTIGQWKKMLMKEPPKKKACKYSPAEAAAMLNAFQKGTNTRQQLTLTCYVTGMKLTHAEIARSTALRRQLVTDALTGVGVPRKIIKFKAPSIPPPCFTSREDLIGTTGEEYRTTAGQYSSEALANYKAVFQDILTWAANNIPEGPGKVNKALMTAMPNILQRSVKRAREVTQVKMAFPEELERNTMYQNADTDSGGATLGECYKIVVKKWPEYDHLQAVQSAFKLADKEKQGYLPMKDFSRFLKYLVLFNEFWFAWGKVSSREAVRKGEWVEICPKVLGTDLSSGEKDHMFNAMNTAKAQEITKTAICAFSAKVQGDSDMNALAKDASAGPADRRATWAEYSKAQHWTNGGGMGKRTQSTQGTPLKKERRSSRALK